LAINTNLNTYQFCRKTQARWDAEARDKLLTQKRTFLLEEYKLGIWTCTQYVSRLKKLEAEMAPEIETPAKKRRLERELSSDDSSTSSIPLGLTSRPASPDWDLSNFDEDS
jgi:hypothetical protein